MISSLGDREPPSFYRWHFRLALICVPASNLWTVPIMPLHLLSLCFYRLHLDYLRLLTPSGSSQHFELEWMLCKRIQEDLSRNWSRHDPEERGSSNGYNQGGQNRLGVRYGSPSDFTRHNSASQGTGSEAAGRERHRSGTSQFFTVSPAVVMAICDSTGASPELAEYALRLARVSIDKVLLPCFLPPSSVQQ